MLRPFWVEKFSKVQKGMKCAGVLITLCTVLIVILLALVYIGPVPVPQSPPPADGFINIPQQVDPTKVIQSNANAQEMNANWRVILDYISKNPSQGILFVQELRKLFFDEQACRIKQPNIDFSKVSDNYHPVFK
jgi:hypothetical protein